MDFDFSFSVAGDGVEAISNGGIMDFRVDYRVDDYPKQPKPEGSDVQRRRVIMEKFNSLGIIAWLGLLVLVFLLVVYSGGFSRSFGALTTGITGVVGQLQGHPSQSVLQKAAS